MIDFAYRISCIISVPSEELLAHAFHVERKRAAINDTYNRPAASLALEDGLTLSALFEPMIQAYADEFGIPRANIIISKYLAASGSPDVMVSFWDGVNEDKFETTLDTMKAIAYKKEKVNLGYGLELYEYITKLPNNTFALRVGTQVPAGDVNLAYVHTPRLDADENISMIDTAYANENVIPSDQIESIVVPDANGVLSYADVLGPDEPIVKRPPYDRFPSKNINLTRRFSRQDGALDSALFYKMDLKYHYDSTAGESGKVVRYGGNQIQITDENGNSLPDTFRYRIFVQASEINPKIFWVKIYLQFNTGEVDTFKVRYNHVDRPVEDNLLKSVTKTVELYGNVTNQASDSDGRVKDVYVEGGKLRIINGVGGYEESSLATVKAADDTQDIYAIEDHPDRDGYRITVPQKSMRDPRPRNMFNYKVSAKFAGEDGKERTVTFGYVTDWVLNKEALMDHEKLDYEDNKKMVGLRVGNGFASGHDMISMMLPLSTPSLPPDAIFEIKDASGTLLYTTTSSADNGQVTTGENNTGSDIPTAVAASSEKPWSGISGGNVRIKNNPIPHIATIFPEQQKREYDFAWEASGVGTTTTSLSYHSEWRVCQNVRIVEENNTTAIQAFQGWDFIGSDLTRGKWEYNKAIDQLECKVNAVEVSGYFNGAHTAKKDYIFSACVRVTDPGDDDMIGLLFRVQDSNHYYIFVWEREDLMTRPDPVSGNGVGRILIGPRGVSASLFYDAALGHKPSDVNPNYDAEWNLSTYKNSTGMAPNKVRIFRASPSNFATYSDALYPNCKYKSDKTGLKFDDITNAVSGSANLGWVKGSQYKIRVVAQGSKFEVYIGNDTDDNALGTLICSAQDSAYPTGSYGLHDISQEQTSWSKMRFTEINNTEICSPWEPVTLTSNNQVQLSSKTADDILKPLVDKYVKDTYGQDFKTILGEPYGVGKDVDMVVSIRISGGGYIWGSTRNPQAGGNLITPWKTSDNGKNIKGTGKVKLMEDGMLTVDVMPTSLSRSDIPGNVLNFSWDRIWQTSGDPVTLSLGSGDAVQVIGNVPPINPIGNPYTIPEDMILKSEGIKKLSDLFESGGIYEKLGIPASTPKDQVLLRIERGDIAGNNKEHRVNYRWRYLQGGMQRFEVDQANGGVNRMRVINTLKGDGSPLDNLRVDLVAWTAFEDLESMPILAIRLNDSRKIEAEKPKVEDKYMEMDNWYVRVKNGRVKRRIRLPFYEPSEQIPRIYISYPELASYAPRQPEEVIEVIMDYTIPEYKDQEFLNQPVMLVEREAPMILNEKMIQTRFAPLVLTSESGISYLQVQALRMNGARNLRISDVDAKKGIIYLHDRIRDEDEVIVQYAYQEDWYTYRGYELSMIKEDIDTFFHLDFNPSPGHQYTVAKTGLREWIPGDMRERDSFEIADRSSNQLLVKQIHLYLRPTSLWIQEQNGPRIIDGTTRVQSIYHTDQGEYFEMESSEYDPTMMRLGKFIAQPNARIDSDMIILDTRSRGGGLDEMLERNVIAQVNKESLHHWDIGFFDGEAYQENGVIILRVPRSILRSPANPSGFHESEVQAALAKHKGYGILPIIEYYDEAPQDNNIIGNSEFLLAKHCEFYNVNQSTGVYFIEYDNSGTGDNMLLKIRDNATYVVSVPANKLKYNAYQIDIKARLQPNADERSAGTVVITFEDGTLQALPLTVISGTDWMVHRLTVELSKPAARVDIRACYGNTNSQGDVDMDYIKMTPVFTTTENLEIIEL